MKDVKQIRGVVWVVLVMFWAGSAWAGAGEDEVKPGFSGYIMPVVGAARTKSLSAVGDDNRRISSLDQGAKAENELVIFPSWRLAFAFEGGATQIWAGSGEESPEKADMMPELGVSHTLANQTRIILAWAPRLIDGEVWKDPFLVGTDRTETDLSAQAFRLAVESLWGTPLNLSYAYATRDVDQEMSGYSRASLSRADLDALKRSGDSHQADISYEVSLGEGWLLEPGLSFARGNADGAANRFDQYGAWISMTWIVGKMTWVSSLSLSRGEYDQAHPVFGKTREDNHQAVSLAMNYQAPFDLEAWSVNLFALYGRQDSNIGFFDETVLAGGLGLAWAF